MADEFSEKIKSLMENPGVMNILSSLMKNNSTTQDSDLENTDISYDTDSPAVDPVQSLQNIMGSFNPGNDRRINLLNAIRPYMRQSRTSNIDKAIKMLKISQISSVFKDI